MTRIFVGDLDTLPSNQDWLRLLPDDPPLPSTPKGWDDLADVHQKYNHEHDERGRFASNGEAAGQPATLGADAMAVKDAIGLYNGAALAEARAADSHLSLFTSNVVPRSLEEEALNTASASRMTGPGVSVDDALNSLDSWNWTHMSEPPRLALIQAVGEQFGVPNVSSQQAQINILQGTTAFQNELEMAHTMVSAQYNDTQQWYQDHPEQSQVGPDGQRYITLYRGSYYPPNQNLPAGLEGAPRTVSTGLESVPPMRVDVNQGPARSWTNDPSWAARFATPGIIHDPYNDAGGRGFVFASQIPVEKILSNGIRGWGVPGAGEHVVIGGPLRANVVKVIQ